MCVNAPACVLAQSRDVATGQCTLPPKNHGALCLSTPHPIGIGAGNKYWLETDYAGPDGTLSFARSYNAGLAVQNTSLGAKWRGTAEIGIRAYTTTPPMAVVSRADGKSYTFTLVNGAYQPEADISDALLRLTDAGGNTTGWRYIRDEATESYDAAGKLQTITRRDGRVQSYTYSDASTPASTAPYPGLLIRVTDAFGRQLNFAYDAGGRMVRMTDPAGGQYLYEYDGASGPAGANNLTAVTYPDGDTDPGNNPKKIYHYAEAAHINGSATCTNAPIGFPNALTGLTDENGVRYATYEYDCQGRAVNEYHAGGVEQYSLAYATDASGNPTGTTVTDPLGSSRTYGFQTILGVVKNTSLSQPGGSGCAAASSATTYDANGNVASRTDFNGNKSCYLYDGTRNLETKRVEALAANADCATSLASPPATARVVSTEWHPNWRLPTRVAEAKKRILYTYFGDTGTGGCAPAGASTALLCARSEQSSADSSGAFGFTATLEGLARTWSYTYDALGRVLTADGPRTDVTDKTTYTYHPDNDPDPGKRGNLATIKNALNHVTQISAYDAHGRPLTLVDANGLTTQLGYDARGRLTSVQAGTEITRYDYYPTGTLKKVTQPDGSSLAYTYDDAHRLTDITDALGNEVRYTLDALGNRTSEEVRDPVGALVRTQSRAYDALGRLKELIRVP